MKCLEGNFLYFLGYSKGPEAALGQMVASISTRGGGEPTAAKAHGIFFYQVETHCVLNMP